MMSLVLNIFCIDIEFYFKSDGSEIPIEQRINLNDILEHRFGYEYASHPRLESLMKMNGGIHRHFLNGEEEAEAFKKNEFIRLHKSTLSKVGFLNSVMKNLITGKIHTKSRGWGIALDRMFESRFAKCVGLISAILFILITIWNLSCVILE